MQCKSHDKDVQCQAEATVTVFWPGQTTVACDRHAQGIARVASAMGFNVDTRPLGPVEQEPQTDGSRTK